MSQWRCFCRFYQTEFQLKRIIILLIFTNHTQRDILYC